MYPNLDRLSMWRDDEGPHFPSYHLHFQDSRSKGSLGSMCAHFLAPILIIDPKIDFFHARGAGFRFPPLPYFSQYHAPGDRVGTVAMVFDEVSQVVASDGLRKRCVAKHFRKGIKFAP